MNFLLPLLEYSGNHHIKFMLSKICKYTHTHIYMLYISLLHSNIYTKPPQDIDKIVNTFFGFLLLLEREARSKTSSNSGMSWLWQLWYAPVPALDREDLICDVQRQPRSKLAKRGNVVCVHSYKLRQKPSEAQNFRASKLSSECSSPLHVFWVQYGQVCKLSWAPISLLMAKAVRRTRVQAGGPSHHTSSFLS